MNKKITEEVTERPEYEGPAFVNMYMENGQLEIDFQAGTDSVENQYLYSLVQLVAASAANN